MEKLLQRFLSKPSDFTFDELSGLLRGLNYEVIKLGKTSGSRVAFVNRNTGHIIRLHKPHPNPELKRYQLDDIETLLRKMGVIE